MIRPGQGGFTLLEVMVALAIFSVGMVALLAIRENCLKEAKMADQLNRARYLAANKMEEILFGYTYVEDGDRGDFEDEGGEVFPGFHWEVELIFEEWGEIPLEEEGEGAAGQMAPTGGGTQQASQKTSGNSFVDFLRGLEGSQYDARQGSGGGGGGGLSNILSGDEEEMQPAEILQKTTLTIYFPVGAQEESLTMVTYAPIPDYVQEDEKLMEEVDKTRERYATEQRQEEKRNRASGGVR